jgi:CheY-like chemotaxis protein
VHSDGPGRGSEFIVELPLMVHSSPHAPSDRDEEPSGRPWRSSRILVVDDNEDAAMLASELLTELGYAVRAAHDGPTALRIAPEFKPDIAILDIGLPVMDGYELGRKLRSLRPGIRLIALTGYGQESNAVRSQQMGFAHHLVKPLDFERLAALLADLDQPQNGS